MIASGLPQRCLRVRRSATACSFVASQARWKPPRPLMARMRPSSSSAAVARGSSSLRRCSEVRSRSGSGVNASASRPGEAGRRHRAVQVEPRSAHVAGVGLRVEAPVRGVDVLRAAFRTHLERLHRRGGPVVGQRLDDREARAAVRAVRERVAVPPVRRVGQLREARGARGDVGRDEGEVAAWPPTRGSRTTAKPSGSTASTSPTARPPSAARGARRPSREPPRPRPASPSTTIVTPSAVLFTQPVEPALAGEVVDEGAEPDPLHDAAHLDARGRRHGSTAPAGGSSTASLAVQRDVRRSRVMAAAVGHERLLSETNSGYASSSRTMASAAVVSSSEPSTSRYGVSWMNALRIWRTLRQRFGKSRNPSSAAAASNSRAGEVGEQARDARARSSRTVSSSVPRIATSAPCAAMMRSRMSSSSASSSAAARMTVISPLAVAVVAADALVEQPLAVRRERARSPSARCRHSGQVATRRRANERVAREEAARGALPEDGRLGRGRGAGALPCAEV